MKDLNWVRRINYLGDSVGGPSSLISLDPDELINIAKTTTGLSDFGDDNYQEDLRSLLSQSKELHTLIRLKFKAMLLIGLRNRLFLTYAIKQQPAIINESINTPIIITGLPRTGTTILFELLSLDHRFRSPLAFEATCPVEPPNNTVTNNISRKEIAQSIFDFEMDITPQLKTMHDHRHDLPAECTMIMLNILCNTFPPLDPTDNYQSSNSKINSRRNYYWHKKVLQTLQYKHLKKIWLLKAPIHLHYLEHLLEYYPNARIIHTHRDPISSVPSFLSLASTDSFAAFKINNIQKAQLYVMRLEGCVRKVIEQRQDGIIPEKQITDIHFQNLMSDPLETIQAVYDKFGLVFDEKLEKDILAYLSNKPRNKFGKHNYQTTDYGLTNKEIRDRFRFYTDYYDIVIEN